MLRAAGSASAAPPQGRRPRNTLRNERDYGYSVLLYTGRVRALHTQVRDAQAQEHPIHKRSAAQHPVIINAVQVQQLCEDGDTVRTGVIL